MQVQLDLTPSIFDTTRNRKRRSVRANPALRPLPKSNLFNQPFQEQYSSVNHIHYDYSLTETSPTPIGHTVLTGSRVPTLEASWKRHSVGQNENIKNLILLQQQHTDRTERSSNSNAFEQKLSHSAAFHTPGNHRSASVEPMLKKLNTKKKSDLIASPVLKSQRQERDSPTPTQKRILPAIASTEGSGFILSEVQSVRERRGSDLNNNIPVALSFKISTQRSTSVEPAAKKTLRERPTTRNTDRSEQQVDYKEKMLGKLKTHLENNELTGRSFPEQPKATCTQPNQVGEEEPQIPGQRAEKTKTNVRQLSLPDALFKKEEEEEAAGEQLEDEQPERNSPSLMFPRLPVNPSELVFAPNIQEDVLKKHIVGVIQGIRYAVKQVKAPPVETIKPKQLNLKKTDNFEKTLVLDLDETLITTRFAENKEKLPPIERGENVLKVKVRPYAEQFLREMSQHFEIIVFTAAEKRYAETCLKLIDPNGTYVKHLLHRENCLRTKKGLFIKDLRIIKNRELKDMVLVDNFTPSFSFQVDNGIPIITWEGDLKDKELKYLMNYLMQAKDYDDMRVCNKERFRLEELADVSLERLNL